uniref:transposase n=2 Tax=Catenibacterium mitsuokai TaxID=100886 RepID=UPI003D76D87F
MIQYHIIRYSKFIFLVLKGNVVEILKQILQKIYYRIKAFVVMPDHVHVFVDVPQTAASCDVVRTFKDISSIELFKAFPQLIQFCRMRYFMA